MNLSRKLLIDGLVFPEGPRWHDDRLWFSDMMAGRVMAVDLDGNLETITEATGWLSGLGWLPDGRLLVVAVQDRRLMRLEKDGLVEAANIESLTTYGANDMVVDETGRAYVGEIGFDLMAGEAPRPAALVLVTPDGEARIVDPDMAVPNGAVITQDGKTLIVAESMADRLTAFDIEPDGSLTHRRVWAAIEGLGPDGICLDAEDGIWVASPMAGEVLRVLEGGTVTHRFSTDPMPLACMLGGPERKILFVCEALHPEQAIPKQSGGQIEILEVDVPGVGIP